MAFEQRHATHLVERVVALRTARQVHAARTAFSTRTLTQQGRGPREERLEHVVRLLGQADAAFREVIHIQPVRRAAGADVAPIAQQRKRHRVHQGVLERVQRGLVGLEIFGQVQPQADGVEHALEGFVELAGHGLAAVRLTVAGDDLPHAQWSHSGHKASLANGDLARRHGLLTRRDRDLHDGRRARMDRLFHQPHHACGRVERCHTVAASVVQVQRTRITLALEVRRLNRANARPSGLQRVRLARRAAQRHFGVGPSRGCPPRRSLAQLACVREPFDEPGRICRKERKVVGFERALRGRADKVADQDRGVARIDRRLLHRPAEEGLRMLNVELVERVVARYQDDHRLAFCAPPYATSLLPEAHGAAGVAGDHRHVERTDVDPQLERVGRDHASQLTAAQTRLDLGALVGAIAGFVCADPPGQLRTQQALHVKQHALDRHAGPAEKDAAVPSAQARATSARTAARVRLPRVRPEGTLLQIGTRGSRRGGRAQTGSSGSACNPPGRCETA